MLEECATKFKSEKEAKEMEQKDAFKALGWGSFFWVWDAAWPINERTKPGKNMTGFKGTVTLLWPYNNRGKPDPQKKGKLAQGVTHLAKVLKTTPIDSFQLNEDEVAEYIIAVFGT